MNKTYSFGLIAVGFVLIFASGMFNLSMLTGEIFTPTGFTEKTYTNSLNAYSITQVHPYDIKEHFCPTATGLFVMDSTCCQCREIGSSAGQLACRNACVAGGGGSGLISLGSCSGNQSEWCEKYIGVNYKNDYAPTNINPEYKLSITANSKNVEISPNQDIKIPLTVILGSSVNIGGTQCCRPDIITMGIFNTICRCIDGSTNCNLSDPNEYNCNGYNFDREKVWDTVRFKVFLDNKQISTLEYGAPNQFRSASRSSTESSTLPFDGYFNLTKAMMETQGLEDGGYHDVRIEYEVIKDNVDAVRALTVTGYDGVSQKKYSLNVGKGVLLDGIKVYKEPNVCTIPPGYSLVTTDISSGNTFTKNNLGRTVEAFCNSYPIWILDNSGQTLISKDAEKLQLLRNGSYLTVPANEVWKVYFVAKTPTDTTVACEPTEVYASTTDECLPMPSFEHICNRGGTYNSIKMSCLTQPVARCLVGAYDEVKELCKLTINKGGSCPEGSEVLPLDENTMICYFKTTPDCDVGVADTDELGKLICSYFPQTIMVDANTKAYIASIEAKLSQVTAELEAKTKTLEEKVALLNELQLSLEAKAKLISALEISNQEKAALVDALKLSLAEKVKLVDALQLSIAEKESLIKALNLSLQEKAALISALEASLQEKASLIDALELSLQEKATLIDALEASLQEKADLISALKASLSEKAALISALEASLAEKAVLIDALQLSLNEKTELVKALSLSLAEKASLIDALEASLAEKASLIESLNLSLAEKTSLIKSLELSLAEKAELLNALELSIEEKVSLIDAISANLTEKAELINALQASIEEKNQIIAMSDSDAVEREQLVLALQTSLQEKVSLVNALQASLAEKAALVNSLQISLQEKAALVNSLNLSLQEKSQLINSLNLSLQEKTTLVQSLQLSLTEKTELIKALDLSLQEKAALIGSLGASLAEKTKLIEALQLSLAEKTQLVNALQVSLEEKAALISALSASLTEKAKLIQALDLSLAEKAKLIDSLKSSLEEKTQLVKALELSLAEKAELINSLKLSLQEKAALIDALDLSLAEKEKLVLSLKLSNEEKQALVEALNLTLAEKEALIRQLEAMKGFGFDNKSIMLLAGVGCIGVGGFTLVSKKSKKKKKWF